MGIFGLLETNEIYYESGPVLFTAATIVSLADMETFENRAAR